MDQPGIEIINHGAYPVALSEIGNTADDPRCDCGEQSGLRTRQKRKVLPRIERNPEKHRGVARNDVQRLRFAAVTQQDNVNEALGPDELASAESEFRREYPDRKTPTSLPDRFFRYVRTRPLLILRFVSPDAPDDLQSLLPQGNLLAWTISFPKSEIEGGTVEYIVNTIRMREMFGEEEIEEEALGDTD
ncbi:MAG: hypothetical protein CVT82_14940 [Alphaproteobacteria bacterium HGW-Alphaproteobacteria-4]|nr:MAG: hypothetical protein CVT82_14940 [Alphaproteobacteria bacterium HGW-Alphaproteobacteria-4]